MNNFKKITEIKNELRDIADFYQHPPKNLDNLLNKYASVLADYPLDAVKNAIKAVSRDAGRFYPTLADIRGLLGNSGGGEKIPGCNWCNEGRIFAKRRDNGFNYAFRCRCQAGQILSLNIPQWSSVTFGNDYERV